MRMPCDLMLLTFEQWAREHQRTPIDWNNPRAVAGAFSDYLTGELGVTSIDPPPSYRAIEHDYLTEDFHRFWYELTHAQVRAISLREALAALAYRDYRAEFYRDLEFLRTQPVGALSYLINRGVFGQPSQEAMRRARLVNDIANVVSVTVSTRSMMQSRSRASSVRDPRFGTQSAQPSRAMVEVRPPTSARTPTPGQAPAPQQRPIPGSSTQPTLRPGRGGYNVREMVRRGLAQHARMSRGRTPATNRARESGAGRRWR